MPLLINNRKFDIRLWVLLTHQLQFLLFKEGYIRTSSQPFTLDPNLILNPFIHLTNNAIQKYSKNYGQFEAGNQLSFQQLQQYFDEHGIECNFKRQIIPKIKEYI